MSIAHDVRPRGSRWSHAASASFVLALLAFFGFWLAPASSGIEQGLQRAAASVSLLVLWSIGALCLGAVAVQVGRGKVACRWPVVSLALALVAAAVPLWIAVGRVTPERLVTGAERGDVEEVRRCLRRGVDVDARYEELLGFGGRRPSVTALGAAAGAGHREVVELLLAAGADLAARDEQGRTPAERAAALGQAELAALLRAAR